MYTQKPAVPIEDKNPIISAVLSFFFPGAGQAYNGQIGKGIGVFICFIIGYMIFVIPGLIVFIYGVYDAYSSAQKMNKGEIPYIASSTGAVIGFIVVELILMALFFFFILALIMGSSPRYY